MELLGSQRQSDQVSATGDRASAWPRPRDLLELTAPLCRHRSVADLVDALSSRVIPAVGAGLAVLVLGPRAAAVALGGRRGTRPLPPRGPADLELDQGLISVESCRARFPDVGELLEASGARCLWAAPLVGEGPLGAIAFALHEEVGPPVAVRELLELLARQIAGALELAQRHEALAAEDDLRGTVVEVTRAAASLELPELIEWLASWLRERSCEQISLALYEPGERALRPHSCFGSPGPLLAVQSSLRAGALIPLEGTQSGRAFTSGTPCLIRARDEVVQVSPGWAKPRLAVFPAQFSSCVVPVVCRGRRLGTLAAASARDGAFEAPAVGLLSRIAEAIAPAVEAALAQRENAELRDRLGRERSWPDPLADAPGDDHLGNDFGEIVGDSEPLREVLALVDAVADAGSTVLLQGDTGTGKELIARAIHQRSDRRGGPFIRLNCAAIPTGLLESELFGHEKGAFTSAVSQKIGRLELAHGGTLVLDEVGDIPLELQPKLLRVLQERAFERLGGTRTVKVDVRLVAATNRDLPGMVAAGLFRSDLYYRLAVFPIAVPPLRERRGDIPRLVRHFVDRSARRLRKSVTVVPPAVLEILCGHDWPGNVRELENVIERAVILSPGPELRLPAGVPTPVVPASRPEVGAPAAPRSLAEAERGFILRALEESSWVVGGPGGAAARLALSRTTLQARMRKLGIARPGQVPPAVRPVQTRRGV
jgi:formate hydrogenlyase transcriptional activator